MALPGMIRTQRLARMTVLAVVLVAAALPLCVVPGCRRVGAARRDHRGSGWRGADSAVHRAGRNGRRGSRAGRGERSCAPTRRRRPRVASCGPSTGANIVIYFGHGTGFPNPYSETLIARRSDGWGLQGPRARGTHEDDLAKGRLAYYGEAWLAANAHPAPGFVMIYSNACYAPGASEGLAAKAGPVRGADPRRELLARRVRDGRVRLLRHRLLRWGSQARACAPRPIGPDIRQCVPLGATVQARCVEPACPPAGAGNADLAPSVRVLRRRRRLLVRLCGQSHGAAWPMPRPVVRRALSRNTTSTSLTGMASSYRFTHGFETTPTVALPVAIGGTSPARDTRWVGVCADRCATAAGGGRVRLLLRNGRPADRQPVAAPRGS